MQAYTAPRRSMIFIQEPFGQPRHRAEPRKQEAQNPRSQQPTQETRGPEDQKKYRLWYGSLRSLKGRNSRHFCATVLRPKSSIWGPWGSILAPWGTILGSFWGSWPLSGPTLATLWESIKKGAIFPRDWSPFWHPFWSPGAPKWRPNPKKSPKSGCLDAVWKKNKKSGVTNRVWRGPICDPYSNYHMFREVRKNPLGSILEAPGLPFWTLLDPLGPLLGLLAPQVVHFGAKKVEQKKRFEKETPK